jgi:hypothetical protein
MKRPSVRMGAEEDWLSPAKGRATCKSGMENTNRPEGVPPCSSGTTQERRKLPREPSDPGERNWPSTVVCTVSASSLMTSLNHCGMTVAVKRNQQWALLCHSLVPTSGRKTRRNDVSKCRPHCYVDKGNLSRKT